MRSFVPFVAFAPLVLGGCAAVCGYTTASQSSVTGNATYDGVPAPLASGSLSAWLHSLSPSITAAGDDETIRTDFRAIPLGVGTIPIERHAFRLCHSHDHWRSEVCGDLTGTLVVTQFYWENPCSDADGAGCPVHFEADLHATTLREGRRIALDLHLHVDDKRVPYTGCLGDRYGK